MRDIEMRRLLRRAASWKRRNMPPSPQRTFRGGGNAHAASKPQPPLANLVEGSPELPEVLSKKMRGLSPVARWGL